MSNKKEVARQGEELAAKYLESKGYLILARNIYFGHQEFDILAKIEKILVFVEVKTRTNDIYGKADEALDGHKYKKLAKGINRYIATRQLNPEAVRLDFVSVDLELKTNKANIKHFIEIM